MFITGYNLDGVSQKCLYNSDNYCDNHPVHVVSKNLIIAPHKTFKDFTQMFPTLIANPTNNPHIVSLNKKLNENNLDIMLAGEFNEQSHRMRLLTVVSSNIDTIKSLKTTREHLQSGLENGSVDFETYLEVLYKVQATFTPMKKTMLGNIQALKTMSSNKEAYFYFPIDVSEMPNSDTLEALREKAGGNRELIPVRRNGKHLEMLSEKPVTKNLYTKILTHKPHNKELRKTGLEQCVVNINLTLTEQHVHTNIMLQGWFRLTHTEERFIKDTYYSQMEPLKERFESIVQEMNQWEIMMAQYRF